MNFKISFFNKSLIILLLSFFTGSSIADELPRQYLRAINLKFAQVNNYSASIVVTTEIPFIKMFPIKATIYFKQPDLLRIKSKSIAILPKQNVDQLFKIMADTASYEAYLQGDEPINGSETKLVNIVPISDTSDVVLAKFWIDIKKSVVLKSQITTRTNGTIIANYTYGSNERYALPEKIIFTVDTKKFKIPKAVSADLNNYNAAQNDKAKLGKKGKITIEFSNYLINKGISSELFIK
ncbi:MAG: hypothetical protein RIQ89_1003 [Bacteroidota bacterium]|jgi:hypothetical protein